MFKRLIPSELITMDKLNNISLPIGFIQSMTDCVSTQDVLNTAAKWINEIFDADRASVTLLNKAENTLEVYAISGNEAIPKGITFPLSETMVGKVFMCEELLFCDELEGSIFQDCQILRQAGFESCMTAPLISAARTLGTLNIAHYHGYRYKREHAIELQCVANWIALNLDLRQKIEELNHQSLIDPLTDAYNRRAYNSDLNEIILDTHTSNDVIHFGFLDLDYFKELNDKFGHLVGDYVLKKLIWIIKQQLKDNGKVYRLGGEEFGIILLCSNTDEALRFFESVRQSVENSVMKYSTIMVRTTVSIGVTASKLEDSNEDQLMKRADNALYQAKKLGRNRVVISL